MISAADRRHALALIAQCCQVCEPTAQSDRVPRLADQGRYLASESSFYRVLRAHGELRHRGRAWALFPPLKFISTAEYHANP